MTPYRLRCKHNGRAHNFTAEQVERAVSSVLRHHGAHGMSLVTVSLADPKGCFGGTWVQPFYFEVEATQAPSAHSLATAVHRLQAWNAVAQKAEIRLFLEKATGLLERNLIA